MVRSGERPARGKNIKAGGVRKGKKKFLASSSEQVGAIPPHVDFAPAIRLLRSRARITCRIVFAECLESRETACKIRQVILAQALSLEVRGAEWTRVRQAGRIGKRDRRLP